MNTYELFINGYNLPKPLTQKENYDLLIKTKQGDISAKNKLINHNIRLVLYEVTQKFKSIDYDKEDLVSIGNMGLIKAINTFDVSKKTSFSTYAIKCIDNEILMFLRKQKKYQNIDSLDRIIYYDNNGSELKIEDAISDDTDIVEEYTNNETYEIIRQLVKNLPNRDKEIIMLHFGFYNGKIHTQKEIADMMSISQPYISRIITKILKKLGKQLQQKSIIELRMEKQTQQIKTEANKKEGENQMAKNLKTIYEYLSPYSKEQIDVILEKLTDDEKSLIALRYGDDLNNPTSTKLSKEQYNKFYGNLIPKMKKLLKNSNNENKEKEIKSKIPEDILKNKKENNSLEELLNHIQKNEEQNKPIIEVPDNTDITKEDYSKILELLRTPIFTKMLTLYSPKEVIIVSLKLGYINGKCFSTSAISEFLDIEPQEVINTTKTILLNYKEKINQIIDDTIKIAIDEPSSLIKN